MVMKYKDKLSRGRDGRPTGRGLDYPKPEVSETSNLDTQKVPIKTTLVEKGLNNMQLNELSVWLDEQIDKFTYKPEKRKNLMTCYFAAKGNLMRKAFILMKKKLNELTK